ncbi:MAG: low molecular weight protein arginine phosphatase, partial [Planctomycetes bacterium]|nr:low molecular weight protein arginine phosphatase [Planctomycetota bacterium]
MKILCVCTGNTCRSPMLESLVRAQVDKANLEIEVSSAGVAAGDGQAASAHSQSCMQERGLDLSKHQSTSVASLELKDYDWCLCMSPNHAMALYDAGVPENALF